MPLLFWLPMIILSGMLTLAAKESLASTSRRRDVPRAPR
jgi:hypothetical protein